LHKEHEAYFINWEDYSTSPIRLINLTLKNQTWKWKMLIIRLHKLTLQF